MTSAPPSPGIDGGSISPAARLSRPDQAKPLTPQGIQPPGRHNAKVGTIGDQAWSQMRVHMWNPVRDAVATTPDWGRSHYKVNERTEVHRQSKTLWLAIGLR